MKSFLVASFLAVVFVAFAECRNDIVKELIYPSDGTTTGSWDEVKYCPLDQFAVGMKMRFDWANGREAKAGKGREAKAGKGREAKAGFDDQGLVGVTLLCNHLPASSYGSNYEVVIVKPNDGEDIGKGTCENTPKYSYFVNSFRIQHYGHGGFDYTDIGDLNVRCNNEKEILGCPDDDWECENDWGQWKEWQDCPSTELGGVPTAICGADLKYFPDAGATAVKYVCCQIPNEARECVAKERVEILLECDNTGGATAITCKYTQENGVLIGFSSSTDDYNQMNDYYYSSMGLTFQDALGRNFEETINCSPTTGHCWSKFDGVTFSPYRNVTVSLDVAPHQKKVVTQVVGICGKYTAKTNTIRTTTSK